MYKLHSGIVNGGEFIRSKGFVQFKTFCANEIIVYGCLMGRAFEKRPKGQVNFSDQKFARRRRCCRKLHIFIFFSRTSGPISTKLVQSILGEGNSSLFKKRTRPFPKEHIHEIVKINWRNLKIFVMANFNQILHKVSLGEGDSSLFRWKTIQFSTSWKLVYLLLINVMI